MADFSSFSSPNLPLWITAACDVNPFDMMEDNIGERAVLNPKGAAVAFYGTTRTVYSSPNSWMNLYFMRHVLSKDDWGRRNTVGDAVRLAKADLIASSNENGYEVNKLHYVLLGDPALKLGVPEYKLVVDSINGTQIGDDLPFANFEAGSIARVSGHVTDASGTRLPDYSGVLSAMVYDSESVITCLNNDGQSDTAVTNVCIPVAIPLSRVCLPLRFRYRWISSIQERPVGFCCTQSTMGSGVRLMGIRKM